MKLHGLFAGLLFLVLSYSVSMVNAQSFMVNHLHTDTDLIPDSVLTKVKENYRLIHGHLSHGWQIDDGLDSLEALNPDYAAQIGNYSLPSRVNALNVMYYYASDKGYWNEDGAATLRGYLDTKENINVALFSWCRNLDENTSGYVHAYLDTLSKLESEYPGIRFIYATGNAQKSGEIGLSRFNNNNIIREYCRNNEKILYDFADLDCWWFNPQTQAWEDSFYTINDTDVPVEHSQFHEELWHHTTVESGIQKAKALWYLLAKLTGWKTDAVAIEDGKDIKQPVKSFMTVSSYPNPFNSSVTIKVQLDNPEPSTLTVYNMLGKKVYSEKNKTNSTKHKYRWNAASKASGIYIYKIQSGIEEKTGKLVLVE